MIQLGPYAPYLDWIDSQTQHMVFLTESWSRINSGSFHHEGLARMLAALKDNFMWLDGEMEVIPLPPLQQVQISGDIAEIPLGEALRIRKRPDAPIQIFLGGHMDTVFSKEHPFQTPVYLNAQRLNGPGVADLKGGLVVMLKALEALERSPFAANIGWEVLINPDEEIGSESSNFLLAQAASRCQLGLVFEPALEDGTLAGGRKGSGNFTFVIRGKAAHAGRAFAEGRNALVAAARLGVALDGLNGTRDGFTLNIGKVEGGGPLNMVPDLAILRLNVRIVDADDQSWVLTQFDGCAAAAAQDGIAISRHGHFTRAPKPMHARNLALFEQVKACGSALGLEVGWRDTGGCCDGNNLWSYGLANVDTLGVRGGNIHSSEEFVVLDSLPERARLAALLLMRIADGSIDLAPIAAKSTSL